jgi:hypothetical protein
LESGYLWYIQTRKVDKPAGRMADRKWAEGSRANNLGPYIQESAGSSNDATELAKLYKALHIAEEMAETSAPEARAMLSESERDRIFKEFQETKARMLAQNASPDELTAHPATLAMLQCNAASDWSR